MKIKVLIILLFCSVMSWGQVTIATLGTPVVENFTGYLGTATLPTNWTVTGTGAFAGTNQATGTTGGWYGNNNMSYLGSGSATNGNATWRLRNNTGSTITSFDISFVARMWRSQTNSPTVSLTYSTNSTGTVPASGALTSILTFNDATASIVAGTTLNQTISSLSIPNGDYIYIRFLHPGGSTSDNLGWDDVSITCNGGCSSAAITAQPSTTVQNLCQSGAATPLSVVATGTTLSYQWYSNTTATNSGGTPVGTSSASYTPVTTATGTLYYYCVVTATCGVSVTSSVSGAVNVTAIPSTPTGTINISADPSCGPATLSYSAPSASIYWQITPTAILTTSPTTTNLVSSTTAGTYTRYVREFNGSCWSPAISITFTVNAPVNITTQPPNRLIADGANTTFTVVATGTTLTYQWQVNTGSGFIDVAASATYSGINSATLTLTAASNTLDGYLYRCVVSGAAPCASVTSSSGLLNFISPVVNNLCSAATILTVNAAAIVNTLTGATLTAPFTKKDVWYSFTPTCNSTHTIVVNGFTGDVDVELFSGACPATTTFLDNSAGTTTTETMSIALTAGTTYYVRVLAFSVAAETSNFNIAVSSSGNLQITNTGSPATGNILRGTANAVIMGFTTTPSCLTSYDITSVTLGTAGVNTATIADVSNFRIVYDANANGVLDGGETSISGAGIGIGTGMVFTLTGQTGLNAARRYLLIADVSAIATSNRVIKINLTPTANLVAALLPSGTISGTALGNSQTIILPTCTSAVISSVTPSSGPVGTQVTITASSGDLTNAVASFGGFSATVVSSSATQLVVIIPVGATTGNLIITDAQPCSAIVGYTIINNDTSTCEGNVSDFIIYEVYDEQKNSGGTIVLYNGTATIKNLSDYRIFRAGTAGGAYSNFATMSGSIAPGAIGTLKVSGSDCGGGATNGTINGGFNDFDGIQLRLSDGTTIIDDVIAPNFIGYYLKRNNNALAADATYDASNWTLVDVGEVPAGTNECLPFAAAPTGGGTAPTVTTQPSLALTCTSTSAAISVVGAEGFSGGLGLAYQWFAIPPSGVWTALTNTSVYTGATSATLNISSLSGLDGYQYYCQVREDVATCFIASNAVKIDIGATQWNGTAPWTNGTPTLSKAAIINGAYNTGTDGSFEACSVTVNGSRTLTIAANTFVNIQNQLTNNGTVTVQNNGSLVQINDTPITANTGNITVQRTATGVISGEDYVYWAAPVTGQTVNGVFSGSSPRYSWATRAINANGGEGTWLPYTGGMDAGSGYIVRDNSSANFTGIPHNGIFTPTIERGDDYTTPGTQGIARTATDDNWNLLGNPYPSALDVVSTGGFLDANTQLEGFIKIWSHATAPVSIVDPFYQNFVSNYDANDYITYNRTGLASSPLDYYVASGQGFMVLMDAGTAATSSVTFNNSMRSKDHINNQFFRNTNNTNSTRNRMWIDLVSASQTNRILVGYVQDATNGLDRMFDAFTDYKTSQNFYSIIEDEPQVIQGKALPFTNTDLVPVGFKTATNGNHTIALAATDGLFANNAQTIYLEDKLLDIWHNLSLNPYNFTSTAGTYNNRFVIRYLDRALNTNDFDLVNNNVAVFVSSAGIKINSNITNIKSYVVYNVLGQTLASESNINNNECVVKNMMKNNQALIVKTTLNNNQVVTRKLIY